MGTLVSDLRGNAFSFENSVCCGFVIYGLYYVEVGSYYADFLESFVLFFNHKWVLNFANNFLSAILIWSCGFYLSICYYGVSH